MKRADLFNNLTVVSVINKNDKTHLAETMHKSIIKHTAFKPKFIFADNGESKSIYTIDKDIKIVKPKTKPIKNNTSDYHGIGLNAIIPLVDTDYTAIIENDAAVLDDAWLDPLVGFDVAAAKKGTIDQLDYHFVCFVLFKTELFRDINWRPSPVRNKSGQYSDTGWEMEEKIKSMSLSVADIRSVRKNKQILAGKRFDYKTQEFEWSGKTIAAHLFRGSDMGRRAGGMGDVIAFKKIVGAKYD